MDYNHHDIAQVDRQNLINIFIEKNSLINLSAIRNEQDIFVKHIVDALEIHKVFIFEKEKNLIDIGTGSGFPLLPIALSQLDMNCVGIDSIRKKVNAVNDMIAQLQIHNARVVWSRIEEYTSISYDYLTARAVAYVDTLLDRSYHLVKKGGYFILYKQLKQQEKDDLVDYCKKKSLYLEKEHIYTLFEGDVERVIYIMKKG